MPPAGALEVPTGPEGTADGGADGADATDDGAGDAGVDELDAAD
jgi:hypothetical protein